MRAIISPDKSASKHLRSRASGSPAGKQPQGSIAAMREEAGFSL